MTGPLKLCIAFYSEDWAIVEHELARDTHRETDLVGNEIDICTEIAQVPVSVYTHYAWVYTCLHLAFANGHTNNVDVTSVD